jgi:ketosteroid isomerase-like protein
VWSQTPPSNDEATHNELRALRDGLIDALNRGDIERELTFVHPNVVMTAPNNEVSRGREGVRAYWTKMMKGPKRVVDSFHCEVSVDELTILYGGDTGISFGSAQQHYKMASGLKLDVTTRWTATLVKENGRWLIASLHVSASLFDNPLLTAAKRIAYWAGGIALLVGLAAGFFLGRRRQRA